MNALEFAARLRQVAVAIREESYQEPLRVAVGEFRGAVAEVFDRQVDSDGVPWPPRKTNPPNPMLIRTGAMYDAATGQQGEIEIVGDHEATAGIGPEIYYAKYHQTGTKKKDGSELMARREFFYLPKRRLPNVRLPIAKHFRKVIIRVMRGGVE